MIIYNFNVLERYQNIEEKYSQVLEIFNSFADKSGKYRRFSEIIKLNINSLKSCFEEFQRGLLIDCYTFSEQIIKNLIYELLEKDSHTNIYLNGFIDSKIPEKSFSPNVSHSKLEHSINSTFNQAITFKFIYSKNNLEARVYDEMVAARHRYAHTGKYEFDFSNFQHVLKFLEYLNYECFLLLNPQERSNFESCLKKIKQSVMTTMDIKKQIQPNTPKEKKEMILNERKNTIREIRDALEMYKEFILKGKDIFILKELFECIEEASRVDLRKGNEVLEYLDDLKIKIKIL